MEEFHYILKKLLSDEIQKKEDLKDIVNGLKKFYITDGKQHRHNDVLNIILKEKNPETASMILAQNIRQIREFLESLEEEQDPEFRSKVERLFDHANVECSHACIQAQNKEELLSTHKAIREIEDRVKRAEGDKKNFDDFFKKQQNQYITILGIFASIVMAFVGGLTFSTSVLSHMHEVSIYRLVFVICCIGFLIFNILFALFSFVLKIVEKENDYWVLLVVNTILIITLVLNVIYYSVYGKEEKESPKQEVNLSIKAKAE